MPRHNDFTNEEMRDMICVYARANFSGFAAARVYRQTYPGRRQPNYKIFQNLFNRLGETGSFRPKNHTGRPKIIRPDQEDEVLVQVTGDPETSTRRLSLATGISQSSIVRLLKKEKFHPFHFTPVQNLLPRDYPTRVSFCRRMRRKQNEDRSFYKNILFTDEATFTRRGVFNWRNSHSWQLENPHLIRERHFQYEFKINVWCGIIGDKFLGPIELPPNLNGELYLNFLRNQLPELFDDIPLIVRINMWYMQDGAPPHFSLQVRNYLNEVFPNRWIGRGSQFPWPPRSPDFNPMDFYVWGYMKSLVYSKTIDTREELWRRIQEAADTIRTNLATFFSVRKSLSKRLKRCIEVGGGHVEHVL